MAALQDYLLLFLVLFFHQKCRAQARNHFGDMGVSEGLLFKFECFRNWIRFEWRNKCFAFLDPEAALVSSLMLRVIQSSNPKQAATSRCIVKMEKYLVNSSKLTSWLFLEVTGFIYHTNLLFF